MGLLFLERFQTGKCLCADVSISRFSSPQFLGLRRYKTFLEWNPDTEIAAAAEKLYGEIDRPLELYAGLQAEATKPVVTGAGLCPGYSISRAILADAIALIRGDRLFTADFTPHNLTAWGITPIARGLQTTLDSDLCSVDFSFVPFPNNSQRIAPMPGSRL
jgi:hypothetical protein